MDVDGHRARIRVRPRLLLLVYAASLAMVVLSSAELTALGSEHVVAAAIRATTSGDVALAQNDIAPLLTDADLAATPGPGRQASLGAALTAIARRTGLLDVVVVDRNGQIVASSGPTAVPAPATQLGSALAGTATAAIGANVPGSSAPDVLVDALPLERGGNVAAVVLLRHDAGPILADRAAAWQSLFITIVSAAAALAGLLYLIFRSANARLIAAEARLLEATRHDPLTGLLNHGAAVTGLTQLIEESGDREVLISVALVDIDNFRLLNAVHGEDVGDAALRTVAGVLVAACPAWTIVSRYGPDEFLVVALDDAAREFATVLQAACGQLAATSLAVGGAEPLPIGVSVGVAHFPFHASGVSELLSAATIALGDAKASGGGEVRITGAWRGGGARSGSFDILQGLVIATDTKDRYTRRHSEDVSRYAVFLAERLDLSVDMRATLQTAGLLHDIGKIGIPDDVLRKPGPLTAREYDIVKQHVALGALIVHDVPDLEQVRDGIRYHHERWDGAGYLDGLKGEEIPLIARILAVADTFSAMTTTRPYRRALPVDEALDRLLDAAGSQLEERLVRVFVQGINSEPGAPLPTIEPYLQRSEGVA
ncbi:MAG TPA: diguanylate cyclase [Candidatus Acidoferrum sp.]|nr:diguanylate cyclase [Candidatus Acidoferrum sp.]